MAKKKPKKAVFLLPLTYNDGTRIPDETLDGMLDEVYHAFGGWTLEGEVRGAYRMQSGERQVEKLLRVAVVLSRSSMPILRKMIGRWCSRLGQEAIYLETSDALVEFILPSSEEL